MSPRSRSLIKTLLPIPLAAAVAALVLLAGCGSAVDTQPGGADLSGSATTIRVHHAATSMFVRGDSAGLSWSRGSAMTGARGGDTWTFTVALKAKLQFKPLADDLAWSRGPNYAVLPGQTVDVWPRFDNDRGTVQRIDSWWSNGLQNNRPVWIYYPPSYGEQPLLHYPVVYMHDGQNLFDPAYSFQGVIWNVQQAMDQGAQDGSIREAIVVGIGNTPDRIREYTPTDGGYGGGGARAYVTFLTDELKPEMDKNLRTSPGRLDTTLLGSSLGGLVSSCAGVWRPDVFGVIGAMSPSTWWDNAMLIGLVAGTRGAAVKPARVYVDSGDAGPDSDDNVNTTRLAQTYQGVGVPVQHVIGHGDSHNESAWARRLPGALRFLLGPRAAMP